MAKKKRKSQGNLGVLQTKSKSLKITRNSQKEGFYYLERQGTFEKHLGKMEDKRKARGGTPSSWRSKAY